MNEEDNMTTTLPQPPRDENPAEALDPSSTPASPENGSEAGQDAPKTKVRKNRMGITDARRLTTRCSSLAAAFGRLRDDLEQTAGEDPQGLKRRLAEAKHQLDMAETHLQNAQDLVTEVHDTLEAL